MDNYLQIKLSMFYYTVVDSSQRVLSLLSKFYCVLAAKTKLFKSYFCEESTKMYILCSFKIMNHYLQKKFSMFYYPVVDSSQRVLSLLSHFYCVLAAKTKLFKSHFCEESTKVYILCSFEIMNHYLQIKFSMFYYPVVDSLQHLVTIVSILLRSHIQQKII